MSEQTYKLTTIVNSGLWANSYIVFRGQEALVVDPGRDWEQILRFLKANALSSVTVVATHGHFDHVEGAAPLVKETGASFWLHRADKELYYHGGNTMDFPYERLTRIEWMEGGEEFQIGGIPLQVIWTPGHTQGSVCLFTPPYLLSGDTLFYGSIGRTDLPGGDLTALLGSIETHLFQLPEETVVLPGHGEQTTLLFERENNPYLQ